MSKHSAYRKVLRMVAELHNRGFQRLRIVPGMAPSGVYWRCAITPVTNVSALHGAKFADAQHDLIAHYTSGQEREYFEWDDVPHVTGGKLAEVFIERFPAITRAGRGPDWVYAGWYQQMMNITYPDSFPMVFADWPLPEDHVSSTGDRNDLRIPLPPPGWGRAVEEPPSFE